MVNQYMHDYNNVETIITSLRNIKKNYEDKIDEIKKLVIDIEGSSSWVDQTIKTSFIYNNGVAVVFENPTTKKQRIFTINER